MTLARIVVNSPLWTLTCSLTFAFPAAAQVEISFLDVAQGDAILIQSAEGHHALIDAGTSPDFAALFPKYGVNQFDIVIASHAHDDHIGGMPNVLRSIPTQLVIDNNLYANTQSYHELTATITESDVHRTAASPGTIQLGNATLTILPLPGLPDQNNNSVGVLLEYGNFRALFTGDSQAEELNFWLDGGMPDVTLLKAAHHGSRNGVTPRWLDVTRPEVVVISVGADNAFGHPDPWALRYHETVAQEIYRTDLHGDVTVVGQLDGTYEVRTQYGQTAKPVARSAAPANLFTTPSTIEMLVVANPPGNDNNNLNGEYVIVRTTSNIPIDIGAWTLCDAVQHCFTFPTGTTLTDSVLVHTGSGNATTSSFFAGFRQAIWNNDGDVATLFDTGGQVVARVQY